MAVQRLDVLDGVSSDELLVKPDLVVRSGTRKEALADPLRKFVRLGVQLGQRWHSRNDDVPTKHSAR